MEELSKEITRIKNDIVELKQKRVYQTDIPNGVIKRRHIEDKVIVFGLAADLPTDNSTGIDAYFCTDTGVLNCYDGSAWLSTTLT